MKLWVDQTSHAREKGGGKQKTLDYSRGMNGHFVLGPFIVADVSYSFLFFTWPISSWPSNIDPRQICLFLILIASRSVQRG
jgi:hypothetical protein